MNKPSSYAPVLLGALLGWSRYPMLNGIIVRLQTARSAAEAADGQIDEHDVVMTANQLRQFAHDLLNAADQFDGRLPERRRRWWQF